MEAMIVLMYLWRVSKNRREKIRQTGGQTDMTQGTQHLDMEVLSFQQRKVYTLGHGCHSSLIKCHLNPKNPEQFDLDFAHH